MEKDEKTFLRDMLITSGLAAAIGAWLFCLLAVILNWTKLPPQLPFFYSLPWGDSWLIQKEHLVWVLSGFAGVLILNLLLARTLVRSQRLLQSYLIWGAAVIEFMFAIDLIKIINLIL